MKDWSVPKLMARYPDNTTWKVDIGVREDSAINFHNEYPGSEWYHIQQQLMEMDEDFEKHDYVRSFANVIIPGSDVLKLMNSNVTIR